MHYAVLLYVDADLEARPGAREWDESLAHHAAFNREAAARGLQMPGQGAALTSAAEATSLRRRDGEVMVTDGPFAEVKEQLWGFYLVDAPDLDAVTDLCGELWELDHGTVEVRPLIPMQMPTGVDAP